ncbi:MAG: hypothetical protein HFH96_00100 [Lachnospiraceae bacterium]|jgi:hypothetical protein|nr:hypothetical protein [uncultured Acetatifactor sp.]MCI9229514.1 hypothetical protein [Lachnospiraceae bacterium]
MKGSGLANWWKREWGTCLRAVLLALLPVIACLVYCVGKGQGIGQIYLPASERNDELIYYKQVEAILRCGYPQGYFGFNESHALRLSFAAWSPVLMLPWVLWGLAFGWNLMSPVLCNIFLLTAAMLLYGLLAKPNWKQVGITAFLFFLFLPFSWYMLCGMPEIGCISLLIVFYGMAVRYLRRESGLLLGLMFALAGILTLMRPYLLLFLFLPAYLWISRGAGDRPEGAIETGEAGRGASRRLLRGIAARWKAILGTAAIFAAVLGAYAAINFFLAAEYLEPLFYMDWLTAFFERGLLGGMRNFLGSVYYAGVEFLRYMKQGAVSGLVSGAIFCCYMVMFLLLLYQGARDFAALRRHRRSGEDAGGLYGQLVLEAHLAFAFLGMLFAQLLMYNFFDGCKHLLTFLAVGIFVVARMRTMYLKKAVLVGASFAYFFFYHGAGFEAYEPDFAQEAVVERMDSFTRAVERNLALTGEVRPNYDNVVIWVLAEELPEGTAYTGWQYLYSLPAGFGISCCTADYVEENFDSLLSRYLCTVPEGPIEDRCRLEGYEKIAENEYAVLYRRY